MPRRWLSSFVRPGFSERRRKHRSFWRPPIRGRTAKAHEAFGAQPQPAGIPLLTFRSLANPTQSQTSPLFPATSGRVALVTHTVAARSVEADYHEIVWLRDETYCPPGRIYARALAVRTLCNPIGETQHV